MLLSLRRASTAALVVALSVVSLNLPMQTVLAMAKNDPVVSAPEARPGEIVVKAKGDSEVFVLKFMTDAPVAALAKEIALNPAVEYAEPNFIMQETALDANDPYYSQQWFLRQIGLPTAWEKTTGSSNVVVAVLDSGVDINHPDLKDNIWTNSAEIPGNGIDDDHNGFTDDVHGWDFVDWSNDPRPSAVVPYSRTALHHGTVVAGIIGAEGNNGKGVTGVNWHVKIMPLRVLDRQGKGDVEQVAEAVEYAVKNGARVINMSFVGPGFSQRLYDALRQAYQSGVLIVAAAGNTSEDPNGTGNLDRSFLYPICYDAADTSGQNWILGVTATDTLDQRSSFANYGTRCVDVSAPGNSFESTQVYDPAKELNDPYGGPWSGTSLSAPVVSGVAALLLADNSKLTNIQTTQRILSTSDSIDGLNRAYAGKIGKGRINAARALRNETGPPTPASISIDVGETVVVPAGLPTARMEVLASTGGVNRSWLLPPGFVTGGGVAVSENARATVTNGQVKVSSLLRGDQQIVVGEGAGGQGRVLTYDITGQKLQQWYAFGRPFGGGISVASGNVTGDGEGDIVVAAETGGGSQVRVFHRDGRLISQFFAYDQRVRGGFELGVGDLDGNGKAEIVVGSTDVNLPVRTFDNNGHKMTEWWPFPNFRGTTHVAAGDINGDGTAEVLLAAVASQTPEVLIDDARGNVLGHFSAFAAGFRGGVRIAAGDVNSDGVDEIITAPASRGGPQIRIFDSRARLLGQYFAYSQWWRGGMALAVLR